MLASRLVCEPLNLWMLCSPNEGAAALVLRRANGASSSRPRVNVAGVALRSHLQGNVLSEEEQWHKLKLVVDTAHDVWGQA